MMSNKVVVQCNIDRLSDLPEAIIHHIFSFLPTNYMFCFNQVSKRFSQLCLSSPYLYFDYDALPGRIKENSSKRTKLCRLIDKCLSRNCTIHSFHLIKFYDYQGHRGTIPDWIQRASECNVQDISIVFGDVNWYRGSPPFPSSIPCLFTIQSLRVLSIKIMSRHSKRYKNVFLPCVILASLESLTLKSITFEGKISLGEWISTYAPNLKKLELTNLSPWSPESLTMCSLESLTLKSINFNGSISLGEWVSTYAPNLRKLELAYVVDKSQWYKRGVISKITHNVLQDLTIRDNRFTPTIDEVSAPKLQFLDFEGPSLPLSRIDFSDIKSLSYASLIINNPVEPYLRSEIVKIMSAAKYLRITASLIKALLLTNSLPISIDNIRHVEIVDKDCMDVKLFSGFISRVPNLAMLEIGQWTDLNKPATSTDSEVLNSYTEVKAGHHQEKEARIYWTDGNDLMLLRYFLQNMTGLTKMTIVCCSYDRSDYISSFLKEQTEVVYAKVPVHFQVTETN